jgi:ribosome-binding protein aMBF1 (putative translation factor)
MAQITPIEQYIIDVARTKRKALNMSQAELSHLMDKNSSFVGHVEDPKHRAKYNVKHIDTLSFIFKCSPANFCQSSQL